MSEDRSSPTLHVSSVSAPIVYLTEPEATSGRLLPFRLRNYLHQSTTDGIAHSEPTCERWAVIATASVPSESLRRQSKLSGWCMVMVVDNDSDCQKWRSALVGNKLVACLDQRGLEKIAHPLANALPKSLIARKNLGYLYAIQHGARVVWDFDDHTLLKFWMPGAAPDGPLYIDDAIKNGKIDTIQPYAHSSLVYNPYSLLSSSSDVLWPRGFPLRYIRENKQPSTNLATLQVDSSSIAVLQSVSDINPDLDAIYRLTRPTPISFKRTLETKPTVLPVGTMSPYNSQATLHFHAGFWALLLPTTVHNRISDIWRSYIAQRLLWDVGLCVGFMPRPIVTREPNSTDVMDDYVAESVLHSKSEHLIEFLQHWKSDASSLVERTEELWIALYNEGYIEQQDVIILQLWLQSLLDIGYKFPDIISNQFKPQNSVKKNTIPPKSTNDGSCKIDTALTFWTSDLHDGTRVDMTSALSNMGHKVVVAGHKGRRSSYPYVFDMTGVSVYTTLSVPIAQQLLTHSTSLDESMIKANFEFYKRDPTISAADAFFCSFPSSMCELWMPFNKSIVYLPAHRYNLGRCTKARWDRLNDHLHLLASMDNPQHIVAAESMYDAEYLRHYTGIIPLPLFSFSGFYTQVPGNEYSPTHNEILVFNFWEDSIKTSTSKFVLKNVRELYPTYSLANLASHRAIVFFPYSVMSYKFTELYSLSIPLFLPSMQLMRAKRFVNLDRTSLSHLYCNLPNLDQVMLAHPNSPHPYSPNVEADIDKEAEAYWMQLSDFYVLPHITYFNNYADLGRKLETADFNEIHLLMLKENELRKNELIDNWCQVSHKVQKGRIVPQNYETAISDLYGVHELQAP